MLYNSGPQTLVRIVEVSVIGGVRFRVCGQQPPDSEGGAQEQGWWL